MADFPSFFYTWIILHHVYLPHLLYPLIWTLRLFPYLGYCEQSVYWILFLKMPLPLALGINIPKWSMELHKGKQHPGSLLIPSTNPAVFFSVSDFMSSFMFLSLPTVFPAFLSTRKDGLLPWPYYNGWAARWFFPNLPGSPQVLRPPCTQAKEDMPEAHWLRVKSVLMQIMVPRKWQAHPYPGVECPILLPSSQPQLSWDIIDI